MSAPGSELGPGSTLGPYQVLSRLGRGAMGTVYRARDASGTEVALKVISGDDAAGPKFVERFRREAAAATSVVHPHVAQCLASSDAGGRLYIALELVPGGTLAERMHRADRLAWRDAATLGREIASALEAVHAAGLVHRDLKPQNVLLDAQGHAKLSDFGIARGVAETNSLTRTGEFLGTAEYMAPEQAGSSHDVDARADLYALGTTLFALIAGQPPFRGPLLAVIKRKLTQVAPRLGSVEASVPAALDALVASLLSCSPDDRPASAQAVREALDAILETEDGSPSRRRGVAVAVGLGLAASVLVAILARPKPGPSPAPGTTPAPVSSPARSSPRPFPTPTASELPRWFVALPEAKRPRQPLPASLAAGTVPGEYEAVRDRTLKLVFVPGGEFEMGGVDEQAFQDNERPIHHVKVSPFFIGKYEVTTAQFRRWVLSLAERPVFPAGLHRNQKVPKTSLTWETPFPDGRLAGDDEPVVQIGPEHALAYAAWVGLDLPSEAQWEYAASWDAEAKDPERRKRRFSWGDDLPGVENPAIANLVDLTLLERESGNFVFPGYTDGFAYAAPVGSFPKDLSPSGCYDMTGNVREICKDAYDSRFYARSPVEDPLCPRPADARAGTPHVARGGSWGGHVASMSLFTRYFESEPRDLTGFRVALMQPR